MPVRGLFCKRYMPADIDIDWPDPHGSHAVVRPCLVIFRARERNEERATENSADEENDGWWWKNDC